MKWTDREGYLARIKNEERFGIFLDMGKGKTSLDLALIEEKLLVQDYKKVLIITPKTVSLATWQNEMDKFSNFHFLKPITRLIDGTVKQRNKLYQETGEYTVDIISSGLTHWMTGKHEKRVSKKTGKEYKVWKPNKLTPDYDLVIVDECSQFKDVTRQRYKALKKLVKKGLFLLSGTPFSNIRLESSFVGKGKERKEVFYYVNADEWYYIFHLLGIYNRTLTEFRTDFCYTVKWDQFNYRMHVETYEALNEVLQEHCITGKLDLKIAKNQYKVYCDIDKKRMKTLTEEYYLETHGNEEVMVMNKANMIGKALQLSNGFVYNEQGEMIRLNNNKLNKLKDLLQVISDNVIIAYCFVEDKEMLLNAFPEMETYEGAETERRWNNGEIKKLLLSPFSERYGLNIQKGGHTVIWFGLVWSAEAYKQLNARIYRPDQEHDVDIFYLLGVDSYDDYVFDMLISKVKVIDDFMEYAERLKK